jgi:hypothetical protein
MNNRHRAFFLLLLFVISAIQCLAQDPQKIIAQSIKAAGGARSLSRVQTLSVQGNISGSDAAEAGAFTMVAKQPNRLYRELHVNNATLIEAYNGKSAWTQNAAGEISTLLGQPAVEMEAAAQFYNARLLNLAKTKVAANYLGHAQILGRAALQLTLTYPTRVVWELFFDAQSYLLVGEKASIAGIPEEIYYDDFRVVNGLKLPYKIELHRNGQIYNVTVTQVDVNEKAGERTFDFPRKSQAQLPDIKKLFEQIDANQKQLDKIKENYAGTHIEENTEYDKNGKVTKQVNNEYTFFYLDGEQVETLVKKDGKPLSGSEQEKENEKTRKHIEELQKKEQKKEAKEEKAKEQGKEAKDEDEADIETFLRVSQFVNPRHERFRSRDVLVFDFEPNPDYKPKSMVEHMISELAGAVWVDEQAMEVVRLEAYFVGGVKLAGGMLASLQKGSSFVFEQAFMNNEVWLPTYDEVHLNARLLLVKGMKVNAVDRYSDYKRFNVETLNTVGKPKGAEEPAPAPGTAPVPSAPHVQ